MSLIKGRNDCLERERDTNIVFRITRMKSDCKTAQKGQCLIQIFQYELNKNSTNKRYSKTLNGSLTKGHLKNRH